MSLLLVNRYYPRRPVLKGLIKYFWVLASDEPKTLDHKLLPVNNIDIVFNLSSPMRYASGEKVDRAPKYSFKGLTKEFYRVHQSGRLNMIGASFFPAGLYPVLKTPLFEFSNCTVDLDAILPEFSLIFEEKFSPRANVMEQIELLEDLFDLLIDKQCIPDRKTYSLLNSFYENINTLTIEAFCTEQGVNHRNLERIFKKFIGTGPKTFKRVNRFQQLLNKLLKHDFNNLTSLAYEYGFHDQAHFIRDFKVFTGCSPSRFLKEKKSVKEILTY